MSFSKVNPILRPRNSQLFACFQSCNVSTIEKSKLKTLKEAYLSEGKYQSISELAKHLSHQIVYYEPKKDKSGVIIVNKPAGVPLKSTQDGFLGLTDAMPDLADILGLKRISVVKTVQRFASGCVLLASEESGENKLKKCLNRARYQSILHETFYALTHGLPRKDSTDEVVDIKLVNIRDDKILDNKPRMEPVIERFLSSKTALKSKETNISRLSVQSEVMSKSSNGRASLFRIEPTSTRQNFVSVYCADMLSPILGDEFYSYRAKPILGKMIKVSPQMSPDSNARVEILPDWFLKSLGLNSAQEHLIPLHLHLGRICLPGFNGKGKDLIVHAPFRPYFLGTADCLGIKMSEELQNDNEMRQYKLIHRKKQPKDVEIIAPDAIENKL